MTEAITFLNGDPDKQDSANRQDEQRSQGSQYYQTNYGFEWDAQACQLSSAQLNSLAYEHARNSVNFVLESARSHLNEDRKLRIEDHKYDLKMKQLAGIEHMRELRDSAQWSILENAEGELILDRRFPDGRSYQTFNLYRVRKWKLTEIRTHGLSEHMELISFEGDQKNIVLVGEQCDNVGFAKALHRNGIEPQVARRVVSTAIDLTYNYLKSKRTEAFLLRHFGWNKTDTGWKYANSTTKTYEEVRNEHQYNL